MVKRTVVLPIRDNDGRRLTAELAECERELLRVAGGFTKTASSGAWVGAGGRTYRDRSRQYSIVLDPGSDAELVAMLPDWARRLRQEAIYTDRAIVDVEFMGPAQ